jgi:D-alanyl-D-alanine carboxypeptidase
MKLGNDLHLFFQVIKKHYYLILLVSFSCKKLSEEIPIAPQIPKPEVTFTMNVNELGEASFTNTSKNADSYSWNFGDGGKSTEQNPKYQYEKSGKYTVELTATGKGGTSKKPQDLEVKIIQKDIATIDSRITDFMNKYNIPGSTLAISKGGKLVYQKGYGFADKESKTLVTPNNRFRIGSQSKTLCAVAIIKLVQDNKLKLTDRVFGQGAILGTEYGNAANYTDDLKNITVHHLLNHSAGAWGTFDQQGDIMGQVVNASNKDFLSHIITNYPLKTKPGSRHSYANFGYFVLARIVEKASGKNYLSYLNEEVFRSIGLKYKIELSGPSLAQKKTEEVKYYPQTPADEFYTYANLNFDRRDGPGGLVMSGSDLLRIICSIDGYNNFPDIISSNSVDLISKPQNLQNYPNYAYGMINNAGWWNHSGSISSQYGIWLRSPSEINITINFNSRIDLTNTSQFNTFNKDLNAILEYITNNPNLYQKLNQF